MSICDSPTEIEIENAILNIVDSKFWTEILKTHWGIQYCYKNIKRYNYITPASLSSYWSIIIKILKHDIQYFRYKYN